MVLRGIYLFFSPLTKSKTIHISVYLKKDMLYMYTSCEAVHGMRGYQPPESYERHREERAVGSSRATLAVARWRNVWFLILNRIFNYSGKLAPTTEPTLLIDILMAGESAVRCLDLPCSISMAAAVKVAAKKFLLKGFLSSGILAILSRNCLGVESEGSIYDFVLRWACSQPGKFCTPHAVAWAAWGPNPPMFPLVPRAVGATDGVLIDHPLFPSPSGVMRLQSFHCAGRSFLLLSRCKLAEPPTVVGHGPLVAVLGRHFCPSRFKRMRVNEMGRRVGVALRRGVGCMIPWSKFIARKDTHFIDDMFHVRVHVKITSPVVVMAKWTNLT
ncbi:hypothetical protein ZWY2020_006805 [Hordeum vulgare]|nr:hypothetical protein ZWY2020_006805 [Hordeum vulgare]